MGAAARFGELKTLFPKGLGSCTHKIFACGAVLKLKLLNSLTHTETTIKSTLISHGVAIKFSKKNREKHFNYALKRSKMEVSAPKAPKKIGVLGTCHKGIPP